MYILGIRKCNMPRKDLYITEKTCIHCYDYAVHCTGRRLLASGECAFTNATEDVHVAGSCITIVVPRGSPHCTPG